MRGIFELVITAVAVVVPAAGAVGQSESIIGIEGFRPETRGVAAGGVAVSELVLSHRGRDQRVWIGYSVQDPMNHWYDAAPSAVTLTGDQTSTHRLEWPVPAGAAPGPYRVVMAVWDGIPGPTANRLLGVDRPASFRVLRGSGLLMEQPSGPWRVASHPLGRGVTRPDRVLVEDGGFRLRMARKSCDGAEVRTDARVGFGTYTVRMKAPNAPGSISSFYLSGDAARQGDEIGIELRNDDSRKAVLTSWRGGRKLRERSVALGFDPRAAFHEYTIEWAERELVFRVDGAQVTRWSSGYPTSPVRVVASAWWPSSLECRPLESDRELIIQAIRLNPSSTSGQSR